jgi:mannose-1-phosphate guanylyltransferase
MAFKLQNLNPDASFVVASSDHLIVNEVDFLKNIELALDFTQKNDALMTLGITPHNPNTGYGYIQYNKNDANNDGIYKLKSFTEKPNLDKAKEFLNAGNYLWNAGNAEDIYDILKKGENAYNTEGEQNFINQHYPTTPNISIDYAVMEKAENVYTIPCNFGWSDLGAWSAIYDELPKNEDHNVIQSDNVLTFEVTNTLVRTPADKLVILRGLDDFIVVDENNVLLIYPKNKEQEIKQVTTTLKQLGKTDKL